MDGRNKIMDTIDRTVEYNAFINDLLIFHMRKGTTLQAEPILGGKKIDLHYLYKAVVDAGGFEKVTKRRSWKQIGAIFDFPRTCTNSAYILKGLYIRNLLGWEEEQVWGKTWEPPEELLGPDAHKASTLAGKTYKKRNGHKADKPIDEDILRQAHKEIRPAPPTLLAFQYPTDTCSISPLHHKLRPTDHVHSTEEFRVDCLRAIEFNDIAKEELIESLGPLGSNIDGALNMMVSLSFECPQEFALAENPELLPRLLALTDTISQESADPTLKILHILRNLSFTDTNARIMATNERLKQKLTAYLLLPSSTLCCIHCLDVLENMSPFIMLDGVHDGYLTCLANLMYTTDRHALLGALRILTLVAANEHNERILLTGPAHNVALRIPPLLLAASDDELKGASLEYLYWFTSRSDQFRRDVLIMHEGADLGIFVSLLMFKSKYYTPRIIPRLSVPQPLPFGEDVHTANPCIPNLSSYHELEEPYRCLGWLKDKFEIVGASNHCALSLDDMYLLYERRYGHEKALRMKDFYTVMRIAFPSAASSLAGNVVAYPILDGTQVYGIQLKPEHLEEESRLMCLWNDCLEQFDNPALLQQHIMHEHVDQADALSCGWVNCESEQFQTKSQVASHLHEEHLATTVDDSEPQGVALAAANLLHILSLDSQSHAYFMPYERELVAMARRRPKLAPIIRSIFSNFVSI